MLKSEIRNPKSEIRISKSETNSKHEGPKFKTAARAWKRMGMF